MKSYLLATLLVLALHASSQNNKWFLTFSSSPILGGPGAAIKSQFRNQGFDDQATSMFLGISFTTDYPIRTQENYMLHFGKKLNDKKSLYFALGLADHSEVKGFKGEGFADYYLVGGTYGKEAKVEYSLWQLTAGYMYSKNSRTKWGLGPTLFLFNSTYQDTAKNTSIIPGVTFTGRVPFGKEKRLIGLELVMEATLAPPASLKIEQKSAGDFEMDKANMVQFSLGLGLSFRR